MITQNDILRISETVEQLYMDCASQLLINLCRHFETDKALASRDWEIKKLSELGALTQESVEIIAANTGKAPKVIRQAISDAIGIELDDLDKTLQKAADAGNIQGVATSWQASESVKAVLKNLLDQAVSDANIVNTTMLASIREQYIYAIQMVLDEEAKDLQRLQAAQQALNTSAFSVATGQEARTSAVRRAIKRIADQGITGFVDRAGRSWTPEAYVNMVTRTTVHNAALQSQRARAADYGVNTFQISSHAAARPLCAPYQGKICSWLSGDRGVVHDLYGVAYDYISIYDTSYGEPAGIFGINCGHFPQTFIDGYSVPRYKELDAEEEAKNAEAYKLSQKQRYLERQVRQAKTEALAYDAAGDKEAFATAAVKVKDRTQRYKTFCADQNRTARMDRTQVAGYNRSVSGRAVNEAKRIAQKAKLPKLLKLEDEKLKQTVDVDFPNLHGVVPAGVDLHNVVVIAGYGTSTRLNDIKRLYTVYPEAGRWDQWQKKTGIALGEEFRYEVHWYENAGNVPPDELKTVRMWKR